MKQNLDGRKPAVIFISATTGNLKVPLIVEQVSQAYPETPIWGASSALGIMMNNEHDYMKGDALGLIALCSSDYQFIVEGASAQTAEAYLQAVEGIIGKVKKQKPDATPNLILLTSNPGPHEEFMLEALKKAFGRDVRIYGGSAGTEAPSPRYSIANEKTYDEGLSIALVYTTKKIGCCYQMGFKARNHHGTATRTEGRWLYEIDGRPALEVYNEWADGYFSKSIEAGESIRGTGQMLHPLAMVKKNEQGHEYHISLSAKTYSKETGAIEFFACIEEGDTLTILEGDTDSLVARGYLAVMKAKTEVWGKAAGGLVFHCSGARLLLEEENRTKELGPKLKAAFGDKPFILMFHNGEHGSIPGSESFHGNLMLDVVVFGE